MSSLTISRTEVVLSRSWTAVTAGESSRTLGDAGLAVRQKRPGSGRELGELARVVAHEVLGHRAGEQRGDEALGHVAMGGAEQLAGRGDERLRGALLIGAGKLGSGHGVLPGRRVIRPLRRSYAAVFPIGPAASRGKSSGLRPRQHVCAVAQDHRRAVPFRTQTR